MRHLAREPRRDAKANLREQQKLWLLNILQIMDVSASRLANETGLSDTTLTRFLKPDHDGLLSADTINQIASYAGVPHPSGTEQTSAKVQHLREEEGAPYRAGDEEGMGRALIASALKGNLNAHAWTMKSNVLALAGIRSGDVLIFDRATEAKNGDIVCAQVEIGRGARTIFRMYQAPNLVGAGFDPLAVRPLQVDGEAIRIAGVMTALIRTRS